MKIYKVGGAVRDELLGCSVTECDWVVVGATPELLLQQGYKAVGKDFPVFLHPDTGEEYALARTERKTGRGYTGFQCYSAADVSLEQDLLRRDLTINAIAMDEQGNLYDPYQGQKDLKDRILRHVSPAFVEDPLRVLRVARFAAKLAKFSFVVAPETNLLMRTIVNNGELSDLTPERVWKEWQRALQESEPRRFFQVLADCGALEILLAKFDAYTMGLQALQLATELQLQAELRFAVFMQCYNDLKAWCQHYRVPKKYSELAQLCQQYYNDFLAIKTYHHENMLNLMEQIDAFRREERWLQYCLACQVCQSVVEKKNVLAAQPYSTLMLAYKAAQSVTAVELIAQGLTGVAIKQALHQRRLQVIQQSVGGCHHD